MKTTIREDAKILFDNAKILFNNNIGIFFRSWNRLKLTFILAFAFLVPILIYILFVLIVKFGSEYLDNSCFSWLREYLKNPDISFFSFYGVIITILGVFMSARVLISINQNETIEVDQYLKMTFRIIEEAKKDSCVYIIAPTFCPGITSGNDALLHRLYERMKQKKSKNGVKFICAFLKYGTKQTLCCEDTGKEPINEIMKDCYHWEFYKQFYKQDYDALNDYLTKKQFIERVAEEINKHYMTIVSIAGEDNIRSLKSDYITQDNEKSFNGFFLVANIAQNPQRQSLHKGIFYIGTFRHDYKTRFYGSLFYNKHITFEMQKFIDTFIETYEVAPENSNKTTQNNNAAN